jgi:GntR family transcriptional repressor for pyruvate dehydrogenase complex
MQQFLDTLLDVISTTNPSFEGDIKLPSERELAASLGVNRATLREKMAVLDAIGFIKRAQGSGTYLTMPRSQILQLTFNMALQMNYTTIEHLTTAREMIEAGVARMAAQNATDKDIKAMKYFLERLLETQDPEYGHELDHAFHMHLSVATHNPVLQIILESFSPSLRKVLQHRRHLVSQIPQGLEKTNETHVAIFEAVRDHDPDRAVKAMEDHFTVWQKFARKATDKQEQTGQHKATV